MRVNGGAEKTRKKQGREGLIKKNKMKIRRRTKIREGTFGRSLRFSNRSISSVWEPSLVCPFIRKTSQRSVPDPQISPQTCNPPWNPYSSTPSLFYHVYPSLSPMYISIHIKSLAFYHLVASRSIMSFGGKERVDEVKVGPQIPTMSPTKDLFGIASPGCQTFDFDPDKGHDDNSRLLNVMCIDRYW